MRSIPAWVWIVGGLAAIALLGSGGYMAYESWMQSDLAQFWAPFLSAAETRYNIPPGLLSRIAYQESHFRQDVIDGTTVSPAGALGLMQLMPAWFDTVRRPVPFSQQDTIDQIDQAARELARLYSDLNDWTQAVAAYNAGEGKIRSVLAGRDTLRPETVNYIAQIFTDLPQYGSTSLV